MTLCILQEEGTVGIGVILFVGILICYHVLEASLVKTLSNSVITLSQIELSVSRWNVCLCSVSKAFSCARDVSYPWNPFPNLRDVFFHVLILPPGREVKVPVSGMRLPPKRGVDSSASA
jgi:hypothetical protein